MRFTQDEYEIIKEGRDKIKLIPNGWIFVEEDLEEIWEQDITS